MLKSTSRLFHKLFSISKLKKFLSNILQKKNKFEYVCNYIVSFFCEGSPNGYSGKIVFLLLRSRFFKSLGPKFIIDSIRFNKLDSVRDYLQKISKTKNIEVDEIASVFFGIILLGDINPDIFLLKKNYLSSEKDEFYKEIFYGLNRIRIYNLSTKINLDQLNKFLLCLSCGNLELLFRVIADEDLTSGLSDVSSAEIFSSRRFEFFEPILSDEKLSKIKRSVKLVPVHLYQFEKVKVIVGNQVLNHQLTTRYIVDEAQKSEHGWVAGCWENFFKVQLHNQLNKTLFIQNDFFAEKSLNSAFLLSGRASKNYFHWLIEDLPKLIAFEKFPKLLNEIAVLVIDDDLPTQHLEALEIVLKSLKLTHLKIFTRKYFEILNINKLFLSSLHTCHIDRFDIPFWVGGGIRLEAIEILRKSILPEVENKTAGYPKKIYITRKSNSARSLTNYAEVEEVAKKYGYVSIYPENLSFLEQVAHFKNASHILAQSGAGLSNVIFCNSGTKILALTSERNKDYPIYSNLSSILQCEFMNLVGANSNKRENFLHEDEYVHSNFKIKTVMLKKVLSSW